MSDVLKRVEAELEERGLLKTEASKVIESANRFRKLCELPDGPLSAKGTIAATFDRYMQESGYQTGSEFSIQVAEAFCKMYPEYSDGLNSQVSAQKQASEHQNLPQEGVTAQDNGDYPNESTGGKAEEQSNAERAQKGQEQMKRDNNKDRQHGPQRIASAEIVRKLRDFNRGYSQFTTLASTQLPKVGIVLASGKQTKAHRKLKANIGLLDELMPQLANHQKSVNAHLRALTASQKLSKQAKDSEEESAIKDVNEAVEMLLESVDVAKGIEETLTQIKNLAEEALPEGGEGEEIPEGELFTEDEEVLPPDETPALEGDELPADEPPADENLADEEIPEEEPPADENLADEEIPPVEEPDKQADFGNMSLLVKGVNHLKKAFDEIKSIVTGSSEYFPDNQRAYDTNVKDMPNESTFRGPENKSNQERANKGKSDISKENKDPGYIHEPGRIQEVKQVKASLVFGKTVADTSIVISMDNKPVMRATYASVAGDQMSDTKNFERFCSGKYRAEVVAAVKTRGLESVRQEMMGRNITTAKAQSQWLAVIQKQANTDVAKVVSSVTGRPFQKTAAADKKLDEKSYYSEAYGDSSYAGELTKNMDKGAAIEAELKTARERELEEENKRLKTEKIARAKATQAVSLARKLSGMYVVPMTSDELATTAKQFMTLDDNGFKVAASLVEKIAARVVPGENGVVHNNLTGVEDGVASGPTTLSDVEGLDSGVESAARNPEKVVTAPDVKAAINRMRRPVEGGAVPQMAKTASRSTALESLASRFTCTENVLRRQGADDKEISEIRRKVSRRIS